MSAAAIEHFESPLPEERWVWQLGRHIPQLDGVRGLAILIVTLYRFSKELPTDTLAGKFFHAWFSLGDRGVDLFFVLSGFLITGILVDAKGSKNYFSHFFVRRSLRIFPLYFSALFLFVLIFQWVNPSRFAQAYEHQFYLWTYLTNVKMSWDNAWCFGYLDHFWSLSVEEHFYLCWPFILYFCSTRTSLWLAGVGIVVSTVSRIGFCALTDNGVAPDVLTIFRCDALLIGSVVALGMRSELGPRRLSAWAMPLFVVCCLLSAIALYFSTRLLTVGHTLWPLMWACLLVWILLSSPRSWLAWLFAILPLRRLGKYSYAMYVFQNPLIPLTAGVVTAQRFGDALSNRLAGHLLYMLVMFGLTFAVAVASWYLLERHFLKLKRFYPTPAAERPALSA